MLEMMSTSSPSTPAARVANSRWIGVPLRASQKISAAIARLTTSSGPAIAGLTVVSSTIATHTARHGGSTFHDVVFSVWKIALEVAVMRLASVPGSRSAK